MTDADATAAAEAAHFQSLLHGLASPPSTATAAHSSAQSLARRTAGMRTTTATADAAVSNARRRDDQRRRGNNERISERGNERSQTTQDPQRRDRAPRHDQHDASQRQRRPPAPSTSTPATSTALTTSLPRLTAQQLQAVAEAHDVDAHAFTARVWYSVDGAERVRREHGETMSMEHQDGAGVARYSVIQLLELRTSPKVVTPEGLAVEWLRTNPNSIPAMGLRTMAQQRTHASRPGQGEERSAGGRRREEQAQGGSGGGGDFAEFGRPLQKWQPDQRRGGNDYRHDSSEETPDWFDTTVEDPLNPRGAFDMERFKEEMRRRELGLDASEDGVTGGSMSAQDEQDALTFGDDLMLESKTATSTATTAATKYAKSTTADYATSDTALSVALATAHADFTRQTTTGGRSRFGGRFFTLDDDGEVDVPDADVYATAGKGISGKGVPDVPVLKADDDVIARFLLKHERMKEQQELVQGSDHGGEQMGDAQQGSQQPMPTQQQPVSTETSNTPKRAAIPTNMPTSVLRKMGNSSSRRTSAAASLVDGQTTSTGTAGGKPSKVETASDGTTTRPPMQSTVAPFDPSSSGGQVSTVNAQQQPAPPASHPQQQPEPQHHMHEPPFPGGPPPGFGMRPPFPLALHPQMLPGGPNSPSVSPPMLGPDGMPFPPPHMPMPPLPPLSFFIENGLPPPIIGPDGRPMPPPPHLLPPGMLQKIFEAAGMPFPPPPGAFPPGMMPMPGAFPPGMRPPMPPGGLSPVPMQQQHAGPPPPGFDPNVHFRPIPVDHQRPMSRNPSPAAMSASPPVGNGGAGGDLSQWFGGMNLAAAGSGPSQPHGPPQGRVLTLDEIEANMNRQRQQQQQGEQQARRR